MMRRLVIAALVAAALVVAGAAGAVALFRAYPVRMSLFAAMTRNYLRSLSAPKGATTTELNPAYKGAAPATPSPLSAAANAAGGDWPSYNRTLTSERYAPLAEINASTVGKLKVLCTYDTGQYTSFESGLIMVEWRADRHHHIRHFLARSGDLRRELAHARGLAALHPVGDARRGLPGRHALPRLPGRAGAGL